MSAALYLATAILSLANGAIILAINPARAINRVFFFASAWISLWFFCVFMAMRAGAEYIDGPAHTVLFWMRLSSGVAAFLVWLIWLMRAVLLSSSEDTTAIFRRSWIWFSISCLIALIAFSKNFIPSDSTPLNSQYGSAYFLYGAAVGTCCLILSIETLQQMRSLTGTRKIQMQFCVLNTACACFLILSLNLLGRIYSLSWPRLFGPIAFSLMHALTLWAVCSHRIFDARQLVVSIAQRALFFCILGGATIAILSGATLIFDRPLDILVSVCVGGGVALLSEPALKRWLGLDHERILLKPRRALIERARKESDTENVKKYFSEFLQDWCQTERVDFLSPRIGDYANSRLGLPSAWEGLPCLCKMGWLTPELLQRMRPQPGAEACANLMIEQQFGILIAVPRNTDHPSLLVALGKKRSLRPYTYPDIRQLIDLVELMDNIVAHATVSQNAAKLTRMESAMMISRSLAHDLNNLTTPVASYLLHRQGQARPGSAEEEVHEAALRSVKTMNEYIRESLFFSRQLSPEIKSVNPDQILASVSALTQKRASQRGITVQFRAELRKSFDADPALFQRLALNLINNAIDASEPGGTIAVFLHSLTADSASLTVSDQGMGIPRENLRRIFDPYFTTKNTGDMDRGLGLGLAICQKIVEVHGGGIHADSTLGTGAIFTATFPQSRGAAAHVRPPAATLSPSVDCNKAGLFPRPA